MRFLLLTPGTGHFYCGSCLRDNALGQGLRALGHEVEVVPLYLPQVLETGTDEAVVRMGGINMFLQQKASLASRLPRFLTGLLDAPGLLRWASRRGKLTDAALLGEMTLSMLSGEDGRQHAELDKLADWVASLAPKPDLVVLSNMLLCGIARRLKQVLPVPLVVTLQGELPFLDCLPPPYSEKSYGVLRRRIADVDACVAVSQWYGEAVTERLGIAADKLHVIHNGVDLSDFAAAPTPLAQRQPPTIGFLARLCRDKGVDQLVEAFLLLKAEGRIPGLRLCLVGVQLAEDRDLLASLRRRWVAHGLADAVEVHTNVSRAEKLRLLSSFSVLSVPATYGESFGLYLLEAMASGVPVVQPRHAAFPELLAATGGGELCAPNDPEALAQALGALLLDTDRAQRLADRGRQSVVERFVASRMAAEFAELAKILVRSHSASTDPHG